MLFVQPPLKTTLMTGGILHITDHDLAPVVKANLFGDAQADHGPGQRHQTANVTEDLTRNMFPESGHERSIMLNLSANQGSGRDSLKVQRAQSGNEGVRVMDDGIAVSVRNVGRCITSLHCRGRSLDILLERMDRR